MSDTSNDGSSREETIGADISHLEERRRFVLLRAIVAAAAGFVPVPVVDEILASIVRARMLSQLAHKRGVVISRDALAVLADEPQTSRARHVALTGLTLVALRRAWRKVFVALAAGRRVEEVAHSFELGTLFDHYCAKHHAGGTIDADRAAALRAAFHEAGPPARRNTFIAAVRRAAAATVSRMGAAGGFLRARAGRFFEEEIASESRGYVATLVEGFEKTWEKAKAKNELATVDPDSDGGAGGFKN